MTNVLWLVQNKVKQKIVVYFQLPSKSYQSFRTIVKNCCPKQKWNNIEKNDIRRELTFYLLLVRKKNSNLVKFGPNILHIPRLSRIFLII